MRIWLQRSATLVVGLTLCLAASELTLRTMGKSPWRRSAQDLAEPTMQVPDPVLGWRPKPGQYFVPPYAPEGQTIEVTILEDGSRLSGRSPKSGAPRVLFIGGSITQGFAISDRETFAWRLQEQFPSIQIVNRGVAGYGSVQVLGLLDEVLKRPDPPREIFYPFIQHHEQRNIAHPNWLRMLSRYSRRGQVTTPYATLDAFENIEYHPPVRYPQWPLHTHLATMAFAETVYADFQARHRTSTSTQVTGRLIIAMKFRANRRGVGFHVVLIQASARGRVHYRNFLRRHDIDFVDCIVPITKDLRVPGEAHPNGKANAIWSDCIGERIREFDWAKPE